MAIAQVPSNAQIFSGLGLLTMMGDQVYAADGEGGRHLGKREY